MQLRVACLCPTYLRPACTANAAILFEMQDYPDKRLYILDDGGTFDGSIVPGHDSIKVRSLDERMPNLPAKYNYLREWAMEDYSPDILMVWENDDIFLPGHISSYVRAYVQDPRLVSARLRHVFAYHPIQKRVVVHDVYTNFHGCLSFRPKVRGEDIRWEATDEAWFDVVFMNKLTQKYPSTKIPILPQYVYRNPAPELPNASTLASGPDDKTWYERYGIHFGRSCCQNEKITLNPTLDSDTKEFLDTFWVTGFLQDIYLKYKNSNTNIMGPSWLL